MAVAECSAFDVSTLIFLRRRENGSNIIRQLKLTTNLQLLSNRRPVSSVGRAPDFCAGGLGFEPRPDQHSGS